MNLKELSVTELKALVYDQSVSIQNAQNNVKIINAEIEARSAPQAEAKPEATPA